MAITLKIDGMHCDGCVRSVEKAANAVEGVSAVVVDLDKGELVAEISAADNLGNLIAAIEDSGFDVEAPAGT